MYGAKHHLFEGLERPPRRSSTAQTNDQARQPSAVSPPTSGASRLPEQNIRKHTQSLRNYPTNATACVPQKPYRTNSEPVNPLSIYPLPQIFYSYGSYIAPLNDSADQNSPSGAHSPKLLGTENSYRQPPPGSRPFEPWYADTPQPNSHYASDPASHPYSSEHTLYSSLQRTEHNRDACDSAYPAQPSNTFHNLGNERSRGRGTNEPSNPNQAPGSAWNNGGYGGPLVQSPWSFDRSRSGGSRQIKEVLVSPKSSSQEQDYSPQRRESTHQDTYTANETVYDEYHSATTLANVQSSPEQVGYFDLSQNLNSMHIGPQNARYSNGTLEGGYSSASRDTNSSDSASWKDRTSLSSVSDDCRESTRYLPPQNSDPTRIDLERSYKNPNRFKCDVNVWQDGQRRNSKLLQYITLLFDSQCEGSNWVAQKIVDRLGASVEEFSPPAEFIGFNGYTMVTSQRTSLSFKISDGGGSTHEAIFLVSAVKDVPFDMLLGANDCVLLDILSPPKLLGLAGRSESEGDKEANKAAAERHAEEKRRVELEAQKKRAKKKREEERKKRDHKEKNRRT